MTLLDNIKKARQERKEQLKQSEWDQIVSSLVVYGHATTENSRHAQTLLNEGLEVTQKTARPFWMDRLFSRTETTYWQISLPKGF